MAAKCICRNVWRVHIGFDSEVAGFARVDLYVPLVGFKGFRTVSCCRKDLNNQPTAEAVKKLLDQNITQVTGIRRLGRGSR